MINKLALFVEENYDKFSHLDESEVQELNPAYLDDELVNIVKTKHNMYKPFLHNGIAVYYCDGLVCVENMDADEEE
jgi:hypothetical protein